MKMRHHKNFLIEPNLSERKDGSGWTVEFTLLKDDADGITQTQFSLQNAFKPEEDASNAVWTVARQTIDMGFQPLL